MKGLLRKDLYMLWYYCRSFLLMIALFAVLALMDTSNSFYTVYPVMLGSVLPVSVISYEERCGWTGYCQTMPLSRKLVVVEKYVFSALCALSMLTVVAIVQFIVFSREISFLWPRYRNMMTSLFAFAFIGPSIILPLIFKLGTEKGRIAYYFVVGAACAIAFMFNDRQFPVIPLPEFLLPILVLGIFAGSCILSVRFYQKREL